MDAERETSPNHTIVRNRTVVGLGPFSLGLFTGFIAVQKGRIAQFEQDSLSCKCLPFSAFIASLRFDRLSVLAAAPLLQFSAVHLRALRLNKRLRVRASGRSWSPSWLDQGALPSFTWKHRNGAIKDGVYWAYSGEVLQRRTSNGGRSLEGQIALAAGICDLRPI
jgi:hypothetical protein